MADKQIICPYCGSTVKIKTLNNPDVICQLCGSSLKDEVQELGKGDSFASPNFDSPFKSQPNTTSTSEPPKYTSPYKPNPKVDQPMHAFPRSQLLKSADRTVLPQKQSFGQAVQKMGSQKPPHGGAFLIFPQINQKVLVPPNINSYHFGRNIILSLIGPTQQYDMEWLNSISRVQKNQRNIVIREHFIISKDNSNNYFIEDRGSSWGTWVNGKQIKGLGKVPIYDGAKIELKLAKPGVDQIVPFVIQFLL